MAVVFAFDIDGVLTEDGDNHHEDLAGTYTLRKPRERAKKLVARAYHCGAYVLLFTGRREPMRRITEDWLHSHGFHYHRLEMGKPYFTYLFDDRMLGATVDEQFDALEEWLDASEAIEARSEGGLWASSEQRRHCERVARSSRSASRQARRGSVEGPLPEDGGP